MRGLLGVESRGRVGERRNVSVHGKEIILTPCQSSCDLGKRDAFMIYRSLVRGSTSWGVVIGRQVGSTKNRRHVASSWRL